MQRSMMVAAITLLVVAQPVAAHELDRPHPDAPPEMAQFSFLVGEWECKAKFLNSDGEYGETSGRWVGYYTLGGFAFQDDWYSPNLRGTTWRTWDPVGKRWVNRWLQAGVDKPAGFTGDTFYGGLKAGRMILEAQGKDTRGSYVDRITFYDIADDHFSWKLDRSYDSGKTWIKNMTMTEATRVEQKEAPAEAVDAAGSSETSPDEPEE